MGAAALEAVAQLTRLTFLDIGDSATEAGPAQLAQLTQLTSLRELWLWGRPIRQQAAALLELPRLGTLWAHSIALPRGQDLGGCAITRLALDAPAAADPQALPQLPALQSLFIGAAPAGIFGISVQTQLTELVVGSCKGVQGAELAAALRGLQQLQALELGHAACFDRQCLVAVAGLPQLQELWLDGGEQGPVPGDSWGMLHRCTQLQRVTLQRCGPISQGTLVALLSQPGMQWVVLRGQHGLEAAAVRDLQAVGQSFGCKLLCREELCAGPRGAVFFDIEMQ
jgi:hypothetical protein